MDQYHQTREAILAANQQLASLLHSTETVLGRNNDSYHHWEQTSISIARYILDQVVRIAVVGTIKSGKSTMINALMANDYLKRGAGVVTSIVTRLRRGEQLKARLFLKSWDEINAEIKQALILFPSSQWQTENHPFDIRRQRDREALTDALLSLNRDLWIGRDGLNAHSVLLSSYLKGYDEIQNLITSDSGVLEFDAMKFGDHRHYVGRDALAVFLKDIQLDIVGDMLADNIEMADCQGSDSPNPLHMAMIQDYLLKAHLVVYVISSRTGVRQADIRFLSMIKHMGIGDNILFICNFDLNEHDSLSDLEALVQRIREELALVVSEPQLFVVSALYHLFQQLPPNEMSPKDKAQLALWRDSTAASGMIELSDGQTQQLKHVMMQKYTRERSALLLKNQLERMVVTVSALSRWIGLNRELRQRDTTEVSAVAQRLHEHQRHLSQIKAMVQSTLDGAVEKLKKDLRQDTDRFFDRHQGPVISRIIGFIRDYQVNVSAFESQLASVGFAHCLYGVFQDFKQAIDLFTTERIAPEILSFAQQQEQRLAEYLRAIAQPFESMTWQTLTQYEDILHKLDASVVSMDRVFNDGIDIEEIKTSSGIVPPPASTVMRYSTEIKSEAILRLGVYNLVRFLRKAIGKPVGPDTLEGVKALKDSVRRIKRETERSVLEFYKSFKENYKFQYLFRLVDLAAAQLADTLNEQLHGYSGNLKELVSTINDHRNDKAQMDEALLSAERDLAALHEQMKILRVEIDALGYEPHISEEGAIT